jgi:hypothetical protein
MVKIVLIYGAEIWSLYEDDKRRINANEMDALTLYALTTTIVAPLPNASKWQMGFNSAFKGLRRSARISKLDRKANEYIRGKIDAHDVILDEITLKQLIWYGHVERMDATLLPKIMIHWEPEGRNKRGHPRRTWKDGIYTAVSGRDLRMGGWNNRRQWSMAIGRRPQTF